MTTTTVALTGTLPTASRGGQACRFCGAACTGPSSISACRRCARRYPSAADFNHGEMYYPLHVYVCEKCFLVQLEEYESAGEYLQRLRVLLVVLRFMAEALRELLRQDDRRASASNEQSFVVEVASNDGYLLQYFVQRNVPVLGIEPAANVAEVAVEKGVPTLVEVFRHRAGEELAAEGRRADLVLGNNVLAQVPDLNDFVEGLKILLKPDGVLTLEFPHLLQLIEHNEFDTIYHEHFSYFSLLTTSRILEAHGLKVFDVEELTSHGGSLRVYACRAESTIPSRRARTWQGACGREKRRPATRSKATRASRSR